MNRIEFLKNITAFGLGAPLLSSFLSGCDEQLVSPSNFQTDFKGKVLIIGAGSAGLMAGYLLKQYGVDFQILEASSNYGGRVKQIEGFADFPIDLGAEWIHDDPSILARMLNGQQVEDKIDLITYNPETIYLWKNGALKKRNFFSNFYQEYKFKHTTWYSFFEKYIVPDIHLNIDFEQPVTAITYNADKILVQTSGNEAFEADRVLVTVPLTILKNEFIQFSPALPSSKIEAINRVEMPDGLKVFIEFSERFYPDILIDGGLMDFLSSSAGEKIFYDAAFRKDSQKHVLGLFTVGKVTSSYTSLADDQKIFEKVMAELDEMFEGKASQFYIQHVVQNWSAEPFIQGSYSHYQDNYAQTMAAIAAPLDNKVFFAGEAVSTYASSTVHGAALSSYDALELMLR